MNLGMGVGVGFGLAVICFFFFKVALYCLYSTVQCYLEKLCYLPSDATLGGRPMCLHGGIILFALHSVVIFVQCTLELSAISVFVPEIS